MIVGAVFYGQPLDNAVVSYAVATLLVAAVGYLAPPNSQSEVIADAGAGHDHGPGNVVEPRCAQP